MALYNNNRAKFKSTRVCPTFVVTGALPTNNTSFEDTNLASGRIGIYKYDGSTDYRWENTTSALALTDKFFIGYNKGGTLIRTPELLTSDLRKSKSAYTAAVKQQSTIGNNGTTGTMGAGLATITADDSYLIKLLDTTAQVFPWNAYTFTEVATGSDTAYTIMYRFAKKMSDDANVQYASRGKRFVRAILKTSLTGSAFANSATVAAVKGATSLTTSANHGVGVGDFLSLSGDLYQAVTGTATTTLVLDRAYTGPTATIANGSTIDLGATAPTYAQIGLLLEAEDAIDTFHIVLGESGVDRFYAATLVQPSQTPSLGIGEYAEVLEMEKRSSQVFGYNWQNEQAFSRYPQQILAASSTAYYTQYVLSVSDRLQAKRPNLYSPIFIYVAQSDSSTVSTLLDTVFTNIPSA